MKDWASTIQAVKGGLNTAAGAIQMAHLQSLEDDVRDRERDLEDARETEDAAITALKAAPSNATLALAAIEAGREVNARTYEALRAGRRLDRAQSDAALYQTISGVMDLGGAVLGDGGDGGGFNGSDALMAGLIGGGAGALAGSLTSGDRGRRRRDD